MWVLSSCAVRSNESAGSTATPRGASEAANLLMTVCNTAGDSSRSQPRASSLAFWGNTSVYPNSDWRIIQGKGCTGSRSALAHRLNGSVGYFMPVYSPTLDAPGLQNALILSFENFPLVTSRIILTTTLSLILNLHQIVSYKLLTTWVRGEPIKTTFACNLTRIKILFSLIRSQKFQGWEGNVKSRCEITQGSLVDVCAAFCESLETWIVLGFLSFRTTLHMLILIW